MTNNDFQEFCTVLSATIMLIKPEFVPTKQYMEFYFLTLKDFDIVQIRRALTKHIQNPVTGMYIPKPADLMKYLKPATGNDAERQWSIVMQAISSCGGRYSNVYFEDVITNTIIHEMNWGNICNITDTSEPFERKRFLQAYENYSNFAPQYEAGVNYGICHNHNVDKLEHEPVYLVRNNGAHELTYTEELPKLVADPKRASALMVELRNNETNNNFAKLLGF